jgi:predicted dienelactone hydrolase
MPRDYIRRRRIRRTAINAVCVGVFGAALGWVLTRQTPPPSFAIHPSSENAAASAFGARPESAPVALRSYPFVAGRFEVQEIADAALHDATRNADIRVSLLFPRNRAKFPVIIFSPDEGDSAACCEALLRDWASHGYAIVRIKRPAGVRTEKPGSTVETIRFKRAIRKDANASKAASAALDVTSVIDSLAALQTRFPEIQGKMDGAHIGVAGHGFGAVAAEAIGGALLELPGQARTNLADPRVRAVISISPQGPGQGGLTEQSFDQLILPYLGVTGDHDAAPPKYAAAAWHKAPFERGQPGEKYELYLHEDDSGAITGGRDAVVADSSQNAEPAAPAVRHVRAATLAFWDAYLKHDVAAKSYLRSDALEKMSAGKVELEKR